MAETNVKQKDFIEVNITWKKIGTDKEKVTFITSKTNEEALRMFLNVQGGFSKVEVISMQNFDRDLNANVGDPILATDETSIIYQMKKAYEESL